MFTMRGTSTKYSNNWRAWPYRSGEQFTTPIYYINVGTFFDKDKSWVKVFTILLRFIFFCSPLHTQYYVSEQLIFGRGLRSKCPYSNDVMLDENIIIIIIIIHTTECTICQLIFLS